MGEGRRTPIGELEDGQEATVVGRIRRAGGGPFWVEDETGRVVVPADGYEVDAWTATDEKLDVIDADVNYVAARLHDIKERRREKEDAALLEEQRSLKELATLLYAIRAHAGGKIHGGKMTRSEQVRFIEEQSRALRNARHELKSIAVALSMREARLEEGDEVAVHAVFQQRPTPGDLGAGSGYRGGETCMTATPFSATEPARVGPTAIPDIATDDPPRGGTDVVPLSVHVRFSPWLVFPWLIATLIASWLFVDELPAVLGASVGVAFIVAFTILVWRMWPGQHRRLRFVDDRLQIQNGFAWTLSDQPMEDVRVEVAYIERTDSNTGPPWCQLVLVVRGDGVAPFGIVEEDNSFREDQAEGLPRRKSARFSVSKERFATLVTKLRVVIPHIPYRD